MTTPIPLKVNFDQYLQTCTPLWRIPELEDQMRERIQGMVDRMLNFEPTHNPEEDLVEFLKRDEDFLGVLLAMTNLSQEKLLRIITAKRFAEQDFGPEWGKKALYSKIKKDRNFALSIARMFIEGKENKTLADNVADFWLDQLSLPDKWYEIIRDDNVIGNIIRKKLSGEYSDLKGKYLEKYICQYLGTDDTKIDHQKGQVSLVGKEVDIAIPSLEKPAIMIMVSYMETTSSSQTTRANEQNKMYQDVIGNNIRHNENCILINVVDGAGWLARRSDLRKMFSGCHHCLNINMLPVLSSLVAWRINERGEK